MSGTVDVEQQGAIAVVTLRNDAKKNALDPPLLDALSAALGRLHLAHGEWEKARRIYRAMLLANLDPQAGVSKADVYLHLGEIHEKLGEGPAQRILRRYVERVIGTAAPRLDLAFRVDAVHLKYRLGDVETDGCDRLHVWLLRIVGALTTPTSMALRCRWRSRPQHQ